MLSNRKARGSGAGSAGDAFVDDFGFVSRSGETRLQHDAALQARYFTYLQQQYLLACAAAPGSDALRRTFERLSLGEDGGDNDDDEAAAAAAAARESALRRVLLGLRKLRQAILASGPPSAFGKDVFMFSVNVAVPTGQHEQYVPAMKWLLDDASALLTNAEAREVGALLTLHLAHFSNDVPAAFGAMQRYNVFGDLALRQVVHAWADRDYVLWRRLFRRESDPARRRMMDFGDRQMAMETLKRIGAAYFFMPQQDVEALAGLPWRDCVEKLGCGWRREEQGRIVIRERRPRPAAAAVT
ncbi:uncharacterized protein V1518DRAFT_456781 [Limtongia smithiae]|uniref:uncharacterized protein n=1 Tax=Limtongia smithiae TaxID=1125753 RepID=UPI0034D007AF